jgi:glycogen operon protein
VDLCLFDDEALDFERIPLRDVTQHVWHAYVPGVGPGQRYGFRAHGPFEPDRGLLFNDAKLLLDPYARAISGRLNWDGPIYATRPGRSILADRADSANSVPHSVVVDQHFDWQGDSPPRHAAGDTVIYEAHVKGLTMRHPAVPRELRGTYLGLASEPILEHLCDLGVTCVELLPIHELVDERDVKARGLVNFWGYNSVGFFAPTGRYSGSGDVGGQVNEFKEMVRRLHAAGLEVLLDVVFNHTGEGNGQGPSLVFRGLDNTTYYHLEPDRPSVTRDYAGTGNSLNLAHPQVIQLVMDSLRYWVSVMHVDGFRFDLASELGRNPEHFSRGAGFFDAIHQDPVLRNVKLIAEPWDVGAGGYQVGNFPMRWSEWNGKYRDNVRRFWKGHLGEVADLANHLSGSSYLYRASGRSPSASVNFVTAHDGFTLRDLVSYAEKHNEANGEDNRDGGSEESWNGGVEGPTDDPKIQSLRLQEQRNLLASLLLSQGVPMLVAGDEMGRTQGGNNNAYCQDNEVSWVDWALDAEQDELLDWTRWLLAFRHEHPILRRRVFFEGAPLATNRIKDISWFKLDGTEMEAGDWANAASRSLGMRLAGSAVRELDERGERMTDHTLLVLFNSYEDDLPFVLPRADRENARWHLLMDTREPRPFTEPPVYRWGESFQLGARSVALFRA